MRKHFVIAHILFIILLRNSGLQAESTWIPPSELKIESTLEVLQGASIYPSSKMLCGPCCLYIGARYLGIDQYSIDEIAKMADWNFSDGTSMLGLQNACQKMSLYAKALELNTAQLADLMNRSDAPAIIEDNKHFYVLLKADNDKFFYATIPFDTGSVEVKKLAEFWDGKALLFSKSPIQIENNLSRLHLLGGFIGFGLIAIVGIGYFLKKLVYARRIIKTAKINNSK